MKIFALRNWSLRRKMYFQFISAVMPLVVVLIYQQDSLSELPAKVNLALQGYNLSLDADDNYRKFLDGIADSVDAEKTSLGDRAKESVAGVAARLKDLIGVDRTVKAEAAAALVDRIQTVAMQPDSIKSLLPMKADINSAKSALAELTNIYKKTLQDLSTQINQQQLRESSRRSILAGVTIATIIMLALIIRRGINNVAIPVAVAVSTARRVAKGDLTGYIEVKSGGDELNELQRALRDMNRHLTDIVGEVRRVSQDISERTHSIANGNQELADRMGTQSEQLADTARRIQSLLGAVARNAGNSREASELARNAALVAGKGGKMVEEVTRTMTIIRDSSEHVANIISIIEDIAFQTNLLALNAAVEAARAGEQGRGFAVVASEVGNLAKRSATTAKQIREIIGASVTNVKAGAELVEATGGTMRDLVNAVSRVASVIVEIEHASSQQSSEAEFASRAIAAVEQMNVQNTELVNSTVEIADSMLSRAERLAAAVSKFKLYRHIRLKIPLHAQLSANDSAYSECTLKNMSATGALLEAGMSLELGSQCRLAIENPHSVDGYVHLECEVTRLGEGTASLHNYGVHFLRVRKQDKQALHQQVRQFFVQSGLDEASQHDLLESLEAIERLPVIAGNATNRLSLPTATTAGSTHDQYRSAAGF